MPLTPLLAVTRLRLRSHLSLPAFFHANPSIHAHIAQSSGFREARILAERWRVFWGMSAWDDADAMGAFMRSGAHQSAMPKLAIW